MRLIETEEAAARLARVILSDIEVYNKDKIGTGADLSAEIEEGYTLFRQRVAPALVPLFKTALKDKGFTRGKEPGTVVATGTTKPPAIQAAAPEPMAEAKTERGYEPVAESQPEPSHDPSQDAEYAAMAPTPPPAAEDQPTPAPVRVPTPQPPPAVEAAPVAAPARTSTPSGAAPAVAAVSPRPVARAARKGPIDTEEEARRLARVISSDIQIYNTAKIASGGDIRGEINEGRTLFKGRVVPALHGIFEAVLADKGLVPGGAKPAKAVEPAEPATEPMIESRPAPVIEALPAPVARPRHAISSAPVAAAAPAPAPQPRQPYAEARPTPAPEARPTPGPDARPTPGPEDRPTPAPESTRAASSRKPDAVTPRPRMAPPPVPAAAMAPSRARNAPVTPPPERVPDDLLSVLPSKIAPLPKAPEAQAVPVHLPPTSEETTEQNPVAPPVDLGVFSLTPQPVAVSVQPAGGAATRVPTPESTPAAALAAQPARIRRATAERMPAAPLSKTPSKRLIVALAVGVSAALVLAIVLLVM